MSNSSTKEEIINLSKTYHVIYISKNDTKIKAILMFVHGLGEHGARHTFWANELVNEIDIGVLLVDLPGHGKSLTIDSINQGELFNLLEVYDDLRELHNKYCDLYEYPLIKIIGGFSLGGLIATDYVIRQISPDTRSLLAVAPAYKIYNTLTIYDSINTLWWALTSPKKLLNIPVNPRKLVKSKKILMDFYNDKLSHGLCTAYLALYTFLTGFWINYCAPFPDNSHICIIHGDKDHITSHLASIDLADNIHANNIKVSMNIIPGGYHHLLGDDDNELSLKIIINWISQILL